MVTQRYVNKNLLLNPKFSDSHEWTFIQGNVSGESFNSSPFSVKTNVVNHTAWVEQHLGFSDAEFIGLLSTAGNKLTISGSVAHALAGQIGFIKFFIGYDSVTIASGDINVPSVNTAFNRFSFTFNLPPVVTIIDLIQIYVKGDGNMYLDDVQLEFGNTLSGFSCIPATGGTIDISTKNFGFVEVNDYSLMEIRTVENTGQEGYLLSYTVPADFELVTAPYYVTPYSTAEIKFRFAPTTAGNKSGTLIIRRSTLYAGSETDFSIPMFGVSLPIVGMENYQYGVGITTDYSDSNFIYNNRLPNLYKVSDTGTQLKRFLQTVDESRLWIKEIIKVNLKLIDVDSCPYFVLPMMATTLGMKLEPGSSTEVQREMIKRQVAVSKFRGTARGLMLLINSICGGEYTDEYGIEHPIDEYGWTVTNIVHLYFWVLRTWDVDMAGSFFGITRTFDDTTTEMKDKMHTLDDIARYLYDDRETIDYPPVQGWYKRRVLGIWLDVPSGDPQEQSKTRQLHTQFEDWGAIDSALMLYKTYV